MSLPTRPPITKALVNRAMCGDQPAMRELVTLVKFAIHWNIARVLLCARRTCRQDIEDVIATTLMALIVDDGGKLIQSWNPSRGSCEAYVRMIAKQKAILFLEKHKEDSADGSDVRELKTDDDCSPEKLCAEKELARKALEQLMSEQKSFNGRRLVNLFIVEQRKTDEVSAMMNMTSNAVDQRRKRLQDRLREILALLGGAQ